MKSCRITIRRMMLLVLMVGLAFGMFTLVSRHIKNYNISKHLKYVNELEERARRAEQSAAETPEQAMTALGHAHAYREMAGMIRRRYGLGARKGDIPKSP
jgi:hypothetical protein